MQARVKWLDHMSFVGESGSGHSIVLDGSPEHGGRNLGVRPMETVLIGLGGCAAFDVMLMLKKGRQQVTDCEVLLDAQRADAVPAVFETIHLKFVVSGVALSDKQVRRAVSLSLEKYCSVTKMLEPTVEISHEVVIDSTT
ncbi:MAG: OsmC family protein, partial [Pseudomonadota bacterium]